MKLTILFSLLFINILFSCKKTETYADNYRLESKNVVYATINLENKERECLKKILNKDSIKQFIQDLNNSKYVGIDEKDNAQGVIALVVLDTCLIRLEIIDNKIRIPSVNKCYELNKKYINMNINNVHSKQNLLFIIL